MQWRVRKPGARARALNQWHSWFAWYPVRVPTSGKGSGQRMIWLESVRRKRTVEYLLHLYTCTYQYEENR